MKRFKKILGVLFFVVLATLLIACNGEDDQYYGERQIPVFLGMTATSNASAPVAHSRTTSYTISNNTSNTNSWFFVNNQWVIHDPARLIDNAQIFGWYDGNGYYHTWSESWFLYLLNKGVGVFGPTNPFPESDIIGEINSTLGVITSDEIAYYANPNSEILINIHLSNPDEFTILSFVFNGRRFQPFEFLPGSNSELLIIRVPLNQITGVREFTLDEILYIEGTEVKNVILHGNQTILVGVRGVNNISVNKTNLATCLDLISFNLNITDRDNLIDLENLNAVIYDGQELLQTISLSLGQNQVTFDNLDSNTIYQIVVFSHFDDLSGTPVGATTHKLLNEFIVTDTPVNFYFSNTVVTQNSIEFDFEWHTQVNNQSMINRLYHQGVLVEETGQLRFTNLLSNNEYTIVSTFVNNQGVNESIEKTFRTLAKATPTIEIIDVAASQTTISFDLSILDADMVGSIYSIELLLGQLVVQTLTDFTELEFENLLSNNAYTIRVVYRYDLNDGAGEQEVSATHLVTTEVKAAPEVSINSIITSQTSIEFNISFIDLDNIGYISSIALLYNQDLVHELIDLSYRVFENLIGFTTYTIVVTYSFDLNDGKGTQTATLSQNVTTQADLSITTTAVRNTSSILIGELIFIEVQLHNPARVPITVVEVNGRVFNPTESSTHDRIFIEFVIDEYFEGGLTYMVVEVLHYAFDGRDYFVEVDQNNYSTAFINGILEVLSIEVVNSNMETIYWGFPNTTYYALITLHNSTGYYIEDISISGLNTPFEQNFVINSNLIKIPFSLSGAQFRDVRLSVNEISYFNDDLSRRDSVIGVRTEIFWVVRGSQTVKITSSEDLLNMNGGHHFVLINDIDLSGIEWIPGGFSGVFDGNGFTIKNMTVVREFENSDTFLGLFAIGFGIIRDLTIQNTFIMAINHTHHITVGVLAAEFHGLIYNVVERGGLISAQALMGVWAGGLIGRESIHRRGIMLINNQASGNVTATSTREANAGGLIGSVGGEPTITNNQASGSITATSTSGRANAGGLIGSGGGETTITNNQASGSVTATSTSSSANAGGLIGSGGATIINNQASGSVTATSTSSSANAGGLIGSVYRRTTIINSQASGSITATSTSAGANAGGLIGFLPDWLSIDLSYSFFINGNDDLGGTQSAIKQLLSLEWQLSNLDWDQSIWLFVDGQLPQLRSFVK